MYTLVLDTEADRDDDGHIPLVNNGSLCYGVAFEPTYAWVESVGGRLNVDGPPFEQLIIYYTAQDGQERTVQVTGPGFYPFVSRNVRVAWGGCDGKMLAHISEAGEAPQFVDFGTHPGGTTQALGIDYGTLASMQAEPGSTADAPGFSTHQGFLFSKRRRTVALRFWMQTSTIIPSITGGKLLAWVTPDGSTNVVNSTGNLDQWARAPELDIDLTGKSARSFVTTVRAAWLPGSRLRYQFDTNWTGTAGVNVVYLQYWGEETN